MLLQPGEWLHRDCRPSRAASTCTAASPPAALRVVQWNIERGYELPRIVAALRALDADVVALQEVDVDCDRSGSLDTGLRIAEELQLNYAYLCEFHELHSPLRPARVQGGERGHHGHAVLSKLDMHSFTTIHHAHQPVDWEKEGERRKEPRRGRRVSMRVVVELGCGERLLLYNSHFEVFAGLLDRVHILADLFADARQQSSSCPNQAILADCNTMAHGIARLSPLYCTDSMRWRSLGWTESEWWAHHILDVSDKDGAINCRLLPFFPPPSPIPALLRNLDPPFVDPFHPYDDVTLISHGGWFQAKLDWALLRGDVAIVRHRTGNDDYRASDHKLLALDLRVGGGAGEQERKGTAHRHRSRRRRCPGVLTCTTNDRVYALHGLVLLSACVALLAYLRAAYSER